MIYILNFKFNVKETSSWSIKSKFLVNGSTKNGITKQDYAKPVSLWNVITKCNVITTWNEIIIGWYEVATRNETITKIVIRNEELIV